MRAVKRGPTACQVPFERMVRGRAYTRPMAVLIDPPLWPKHGTVWSHLVSDTSIEELIAFADRNRVPRRGFDLDHYDVPAERYDELVAAGAEPVPPRELVRRLAASGLRVRPRERRSFG